MEIIYKGTLYTVPVLSPKEIDGARLYNLATQTYIETLLMGGEKDENGMFQYAIKLTPGNTASAPQGIYNLELFSNTTDGVIIEAYYENYAKVKESSFTKTYN